MSAQVGDKSEKPEIDSSVLKDLDEAIIEDMPWAQNMLQKYQEDLRLNFLNWCAVAKEVGGADGKHTKDWGKHYGETLNVLLRDMLNDILGVQDKTTDTIQILLQKLQRLCEALKEPMPNIGADGLCLYEEQKRLQNYIAKWESVLNLKIQELKKFEKKYLTLCKSLGEEPRLKWEYPRMPIADALHTYECSIQQLETTLFERHERFCHLKAVIAEHVEQLHYKPTCEFEKKVLSDAIVEFTQNNMAQLECFAAELEKIKQSIEDDIAHLRSRIEDLWNMIETDLKYRDDFRTLHAGSSLDVVEKLREELRRCEVLKKENIQDFVEKLRSRLEELWRKCHCAESVKSSFTCFYSDCYTEDLLDLHEIEIDKWEKYYKDNKQLIQLVEKHKELWQAVRVLEENASATNRYKNRGGNLLQEEKERNKLSKLIPKLEADIFALCEEYKNNNSGASFTTFGQTPEATIQYMHEKRDIDRRMKLSARKMQRELTPGLSSTKLPVSCFGASTSKMVVTPTAKRKLLASPNPTKKLKNEVQKNPKATPLAKHFPKKKITVATRPLAGQKRRSQTSIERHQRRKSGRKTSRIAPLINEESDHDTQSTTYTKFEMEQLSSNEAHSTIIHEQISPSKKTPNRVLLTVPSPRSPLTPKTPSQLSTCKTNLKLLF
ncbi:protein regulator of cytokinesis 1 isoform X1 [Dendroctonus ponderosae]|uniref:Protein regulator of cytokinesis 1 n=1 Tax=Dendroctonus ponderosae TaxID=77166 RepID=A0AAR5QCN7_DENPD|nr:protein regulator of cytokinesis 1 isoform X1 [Dendroctonus ponderosae]